jgi:hypothetical protein
MPMLYRNRAGSTDAIILGNEYLNEGNPSKLRMRSRILREVADSGK